MVKYISALIILATLASCNHSNQNVSHISGANWFDNSFKKGEFAVASIPANKRMVVAFKDDNGKLFVCAEPSPDAYSNGVDIKTGMLGVTGKTAEGKLEYGTVNVVNMHPFFQRSQGLQFYRDYKMHECIRNITENYNKKDTNPTPINTDSASILTIAKELIDTEIKQNNGK
jgi:hypothetical protein